MFSRNTHIVYIGLWFALLAAWLYNYLYSLESAQSSSSRYVEAAAVGVLFGALLALATWVLTWLMDHPLRNRGPLAILVWTLATVAGFFAFQLISSLPKGVWEQCPGPPEKATEILGDYGASGLFVSTESGTLYAWTYQGWNRAASLPTQREKSVADCSGPQEGPLFYPLPPGRVVSSRVVDLCGPDYSRHTKYIVLNDGTIWEWSRSSGVYGEMLAFICSLGGGILIGVAAARAVIRNDPYQAPAP